MKTATVTEFRSRMKERLQELEDDQDILILSGPKKKDYVVLTLEAFNAMEETAYLLSNPANAKRLMDSIAQDQEGSATVRKLNLDEGKSVKAAAVKKSPSRKYATVKQRK